MVESVTDISIASRDLGSTEPQGVWVDLVSQVPETTVEDGENFFSAVWSEGNDGGAEFCIGMEAWQSSVSEVQDI